MKNLFYAALPVITLFLCGNVFADDSWNNAESVYQACKATRAHALKEPEATTARHQCDQLISFGEGFESGTPAAVLGFISHDPKTVATFTTGEAMTDRILAVKKYTDCIAPDTTSEQLVDVFMNYVENNPESKQYAFYGAMRQAIYNNYCNRP